MAKKEVLEAIATLVGTVIGAGVLGIPYVVASAGFLTGLLDILVLGVVVMVLYLFYGEVVLRTKGVHQLTGYAEKYLGKIGKLGAVVSMTLGVYGALIAYVIGVGASLSALFGGPSFVFSILFIVVGSVVVYTGLKAIKSSELVLSIIIIGTVLLISFLAFGKVESGNVAAFDLKYVFLPYGVILFAYLGTAAIPEMREELAGNEKMLKRAIIIGMAIPILLYALFSFIVVGVVGLQGFGGLAENERIATIALGSFVGNHLAVLGNVFAVAAMIASFLALGLALMEMFMYDYKYSKHKAFFLTMAVPVVVGLADLTDFIQIIGISGVITGCLNGCIIVLMLWSAKQKGNRKPEYSISKSVVIGLILMLVLIMGVVHKLFVSI